MTHAPVLLPEALTGLRIQADGCYVDCTFGRGGHARAILSALGPAGRLIGFDRDPEAVVEGEALRKSDARFSILHRPFSEFQAGLASLGIHAVDGVLMDLGVSSPQLDTPSRGFSFQSDGPLDMRMDPTRDQSAADWLSVADEEEIARVLWVFGEERHARRIARAICLARVETPLQTTHALVDVVRAAQPRLDPGKHPATRSFQAIRMHINRELGEIEDALGAIVNGLNPQGRLVVISFHSLEDRLVKRFFRDASRPPAGDPRMPLPDSVAAPKLHVVGKAIKATPGEVATNPRARSAVMRIVERREAA